jgi:hypothetical protein
VLTDEDGDGFVDDWVEGDGTPADPAYNYDDTTAQNAATGARYLVCWNDADNDGEVDAGEMHQHLIFNILAAAGSGQQGTLTLDTAGFTPAP